MVKHRSVVMKDIFNVHEGFNAIIEKTKFSTRARTGVAFLEDSLLSSNAEGNIATKTVSGKDSILSEFMFLHNHLAMVQRDNCKAPKSQCTSLVN